MNSKDDMMLLETRQLIYSFLGSVYYRMPHADQLTAILDQQLFHGFPLEIDEPEFQQGLGLLKLWMEESLKASKDDVLAALRQDYTALFIGPGHLPAPPWESVYLTAERLTFGPQTLAVRAFYQKYGLALEKLNAEPDDHFGLELEFMAKLIAWQVQQIKAEQPEAALLTEQEQMLFLTEHVMKWAGLFTQDVADNAATAYYRGLALLSRGFLNWDYANYQE